MAKVIREFVNTTVDLRTGEAISETSHKVVQLPTEPAYIKMYINDICQLTGVQNADQGLLRALLLRLGYDGYVVLTPRIRQTIGRQLDISEKTIRNRLANLVKAALITPVARNEYMVNPDYFARGDWKQICEMRKDFSLKLMYRSNGERSVSFEDETPDNN